MFTWDFILGEKKCFQCFFWAICYNYLHDTNQNKTHCGCCGHFDRNEFLFRVIKYHVNTTQNEVSKQNESNGNGNGNGK